MQRTAIIGFLTAVLIGNLVLALSQPRPTRAVSDPSDTRPAAERLASKRVASYAELAVAAAAVGLELSRRFVGIVDRIVRIDDGDVNMVGWLADFDGDSTPLDVVVFVAGAAAGSTKTQGERPDVTRDVGLGFGAEKNVSFRVRFGCRSGEYPVVAGVGSKNRYIPLTSAPPCP
jgi:hypothetical protein